MITIKTNNPCLAMCKQRCSSVGGGVATRSLPTPLARLASSSENVAKCGKIQNVAKCDKITNVAKCDKLWELCEIVKDLREVFVLTPSGSR